MSIPSHETQIAVTRIARTACDAFLAAFLRSDDHYGVRENDWEVFCLVNATALNIANAFYADANMFGFATRSAPFRLWQEKQSSKRSQFTSLLRKQRNSGTATMHSMLSDARDELYDAFEVVLSQLEIALLRQEAKRAKGGIS